MEESERAEKKRLDLDWATLLDNDDPPPELIVKPSLSSAAASADGCRSSSMDSEDGIDTMPDQKLDDSIDRNIRNLEKLGPKLPDGGEKIRSMLFRLRAEKERRSLRLLEKDTDESVKLTQTPSRIVHGVSDSLSGENASFTGAQQSSFGKCFSRKLDENIDSRSSNVQKNECQLRMKSIGKFSPKKRKKGCSSSRKQPYPGPRSLSMERVERFPNGDRKSRSPAIYSLRDRGGIFSSRVAIRENDFQVPPFKDLKPRKEPTVVLLDEEDCQLMETTEGCKEVNECMKDIKIYYPSRNDPESVEISYADVECLTPEHYLTSPIMNFYILYLQRQASLSDWRMNDYHFFNTYFYKKLQEALSCEGKEKDILFVKFRRWWKGVNIFQKAYIFIPVHEDLHWSLAIICIPDKGDKSGPIILHLDSLRLHRSRSVFDNLRSFLIEEWSFLRQQVSLSDLIEEAIWNALPSRIDEKIIMVPQQKNDYDCGLFVLYFMERFIKEAPDRLKKKDLVMFGKRLFKSEEAPGLREKVHNLLMKEFEHAMKGQHALGSSGSAEAPAECMVVEDP